MSGEDIVMDFVDVVRAYFHALARRQEYVKLPSEDHAEGMRGLLKRAMYGTRDAAQNWESAYAELVEDLGFARGKSNPCIFWHEAREVRIVVHGDDITVFGPEDELDRFREEISKQMSVKFRARLARGWSSVYIESDGAGK